MGARADTALAVVVVPQATDALVEEDVFQMLAGALPVLAAAGCALVGGHTSEGAELSLGVPPPVGWRGGTYCLLDRCCSGVGR